MPSGQVLRLVFSELKPHLLVESLGWCLLDLRPRLLVESVGWGFLELRPRLLVEF